MADSASSMHVALIGDVVGSRRHGDRRALQRRLADALAAADPELSVRAPYATFADEFQAVAPDPGSAVRLALGLRLALAPAVDVRIGLGLGPYDDVDVGADPPTVDGPAWWAARTAVERAESLADQPGTQHVRTRAAALGPSGAAADVVTGQLVDTLNAYLGLQDALVAGLTERQRRLLTGTLEGRTQRELAAAEGIGQPAVSQALRQSGARALVEAITVS